MSTNPITLVKPLEIPCHILLHRSPQPWDEIVLGEEDLAEIADNVRLLVRGIGELYLLPTVPASDHAVRQPTALEIFDRTADGKELTGKSAIPKLTFKEEQERRYARIRDFKSAVSYREDFRCPECDSVLSGKIKYKQHLREIHEWRVTQVERHLGIAPRVYSCPQCPKRFNRFRRFLNQHARLRHGLSLKALSALLNPKPVVPDAPTPTSMSDEAVKVLRANSINPRDCEDIRTQLSPEIMEVLKKGKPSLYGKIEGENVTRYPREPRRKKKPEPPPLEPCYEEVFNSFIFQLLVPDDTERRCFLLYHAANKSLREIAVEVFGDESKKPRVQKICIRALDQAMRWLKRAHLTARPGTSDYPVYLEIMNAVRGESSLEKFELEIENYKEFRGHDSSDFGTSVFEQNDEAASGGDDVSVRKR